MMKSLSLRSKTVLLSALLLGACALADLPRLNEETANRLASPAWMNPRYISAGMFELKAYERMHERYETANVYIGGDGKSPKNPVGLHLASKDKAENVVYLARPCQYTTRMADGKKCDEKYMGDAQYGEDVIASYQAALDEISRRYDITAFHLIGYDGGAAIATLLAAKRKDILSVRTVAGILDHQAYTDFHGKPALTGSLNPRDEANNLKDMPQYHFIGGRDKDVTPVVLNSYMQATPPTRCVQTMLIQEAGHDDGWVDKWPELLQEKVTCYSGKPVNDFTAYDLSTPVNPPKAKPGTYITIPETPEKP